MRSRYFFILVQSFLAAVLHYDTDIGNNIIVIEIITNNIHSRNDPAAQESVGGGRADGQVGASARRALYSYTISYHIIYYTNICNGGGFTKGFSCLGFSSPRGTTRPPSIHNTYHTLHASNITSWPPGSR
jgi:hypothetical protein